MCNVGVKADGGWEKRVMENGTSFNSVSLLTKLLGQRMGANEMIVG